MAYNNWQQPNNYNHQYHANPGGGIPGQYNRPPPQAQPAPHQNTTYPQWGQPPVSQGYGAPSAPYQYAAPPPAPPPQSQQVPSYMNYNPSVYGGLAGNTTPMAQQPPTLPPRTQHGGQQPQGWSHGTNLAPAPFKPSVTGSVRYKPSGWQQSNVPAPVPERPSSSGYNSGPWPEYQESPQSSPMQQPATTTSASVSPPYSPDPGRTPTLPPRPLATPSPLDATHYYPPPPPPGSSTQAQPPSQGGGWFNPSGSMFPQAPAGAVADTPPPMPPRPAPHRQSGPVSPIEHRDSVNSLYEPPPPHSRLVSRPDSGSSKDSSYHVSIPGELQKPSPTPPPQTSGGPSAFSLGASSDWEHFDTGNGEDVDDTALYARKAESELAAVLMPELDSTEVQPVKPPEPTVVEPPEPIEVQTRTSTPAPPSVKEEEKKLPAAEPDKHEIDIPIVRSESPEPLDDRNEEDEKTKPGGADMTASLDNHLRKLTMEESHFSTLTAKATAPTASTSSVDIAPGLDVWYKSSLLRCIAMLYREAGASEVDEKHKIFLDFVTEEARLRGIELPEKSSTLQLPTQEWSEVFSPSDVVISGAELQVKGAANDADRTVRKTVVIPPTSPDDETEYSPGGRPVMQRPTSSGQGDQSKGHKPSVSVTSIYSQAGASPPRHPPESPEPAPILAAEIVNPADKPPQPPPLSTKPAYVPFRDRNNSTASLQTPGALSPGPQTPQTALNVANSSMQGGYRPYVPFSAGIQPLGAVLQVAGKTDGPLPNSDAQSPSAAGVPSQPSKEAESPQHPPTLQPALGAAVKKQDPSLNDPRSPVAPLISIKPPSVLGHRKQASTASPAVQQLDSLVFQTNQEPPLNPRLENLKTSLLLYPSDYNFVTTAFEKWKTTAAGNRARAEAEARNRYNDSQHHIDSLYNENQIAYQDIALLEDSFKKQEAEVRRQENETEYESYLIEVFDPLYKRLQEEIGAVTELLLEAQNMVKEDGVAGKALLHLHGSDKVDLAEGLGLVVELHHKLEERHAELVECIIKRDRRRQAIDEAAAEGADKLTQMEFRQRLDSIERAASVSRCEDKKARVQPLWQLCRAGAMRGSRENKAFAAEVRRGVEAAGDDLVGADHTLLKVRALHTLEELARRSHALEAAFYGVDTQLNLVEYEAAMAHATLDKAPRHVAAKLTEEKNAEDVRLKSEHEERLRAVQATLQEGQDAVEKVSRGLLGNTERALRAQEELERAKRRTGDFRNALSVLSPV